MEKKISEDQELQMEWTYQAPIDLVFDALTLPEHLKNWYCPNHLAITFAESNPEVGGEYKVGVVQPDEKGSEMMFIGKYLEIKKPHLLVYTQTFMMGKDYPPIPETTITIKLEQKESKTIVKLIQTGFAVTGSYEGAKMSWPGIYAKLGKYLETLM